MSVVAGLKVEIAFTAGTWTDVTADVDYGQSIQIKSGRSSVFSAPQTGTCTFQLWNESGRYSPKSQLLSDGVTAHPYYPHVAPGVPVRVSYAVAGVQQYRFVGIIKQWLYGMAGGVRPFVTVSANDLLDALSRQVLRGFVIEETAYQAKLVGGQSALYLFNDALSGVSSAFVDTFGVGGALNIKASPTYSAFVLSSSSVAVPVSDGLTGVSVASADSLETWAPATGLLCASITGDIATSGWVTAQSLAAGDGNAGTQAYQLLVFSPNGSNILGVQCFYPNAPGSPFQVNTYAQYNNATLGQTALANVAADGLPHHLAATLTTSGGVQTLTLYIDGAVAVASVVLSAAFGGIASPQFRVGAFSSNSTKPVVIGPATAHWGGTYSSNLPSSLHSAGYGWLGDTTAARVQHFLEYAGYTPAGWSLDVASQYISGVQPVKGQSVLALCQQAAKTESGGSVFYALAGLARFVNRRFRDPGAPVATVDAVGDVLGDVWAPSFDSLASINTSTVTAAGLPPQTATNVPAQAVFGVLTDTASAYPVTALAALNIAQWRVASSQPGLRLPLLHVDLLTAQTAGLYGAFAALQIGSRVRVVNLPVGALAGQQVDVIVEGITETIGLDRYVVSLDASPADTPQAAMWGSSTLGRWAPSSGATTLVTAVSATAASISVQTSGGAPTFTTAAGSYPLAIRIGEEELTVTVAPAAGNPQTLTVTRGTSSTQAAPQSAGAVVTLSPPAGWTI